jgi:hypothetical protein
MFVAARLFQPDATLEHAIKLMGDRGARIQCDGAAVLPFSSGAGARVGSSGVTITITGSNFANGEHHMINWASWVGKGSERGHSRRPADGAGFSPDLRHHGMRSM